MSIPSNFSSLESSPIESEIDGWVKQVAQQCEASAIHWCDGSQEEYDNLCKLLVKKGTFIELNPV
jgi:phosphoenolpyruvate carboxykinase (GTP)